ncbi:MAG: hypothetical protein Q9182_002932 [Xanthomendoza sp. 2 TL-2023]
MADNSNPGNFANRPKEEVQAAAQKGGQTSTTGGFASMDPDKQAITCVTEKGRMSIGRDLINYYAAISSHFN